jgi:hypothetical protein
MARVSNRIVFKSTFFFTLEFGGIIAGPDTVGIFLRKANNINNKLINFYPVMLTRLLAV